MTCFNDFYRFYGNTFYCIYVLILLRCTSSFLFLCLILTLVTLKCFYRFVVKLSSIRSFHLYILYLIIQYLWAALNNYALLWTISLLPIILILYFHGTALCCHSVTSRIHISYYLRWWFITMAAITLYRSLICIYFSNTFLLV